MDEKLEKAFGVANYMATLTNQKRIIKEEFDQLMKLVASLKELLGSEHLRFELIKTELLEVKNLALFKKYFSLLASSLT